MSDEHSVTGSIKRGSRLWIGGHHRPVRRVVERWLSGLDTSRPAEGPIDAAFITAESADEAIYFLNKLSPRLGEGSIVIFVFRSLDAVTNERAEVPFSSELNDRLCSLGWSVVGPILPLKEMVHEVPSGGSSGQVQKASTEAETALNGLDFLRAVRRVDRTSR